MFNYIGIQATVRARLPILNGPYMLDIMQEKQRDAAIRRQRWIMLHKELPAAVHLRRVRQVRVTLYTLCVMLLYNDDTANCLILLHIMQNRLSVYNIT